MGGAYVHHTKEGRIGTFYLRLLGIKQKDQA